MTNNDDAQERPASEAPKKNMPVLSDQQFITLAANTTQLDLSGLTEEQIQELKMKHAETMIKVNETAAGLGTAVGALRESLGTMTEAANNAVAQEGQSVTITQTQDNILGKTEIIIGNTEAARRGPGNNTMIWFVLAVVVIIAVVIIAVTRG